MTKAERAIKALREAADSLDEMPFRMNMFFGPVNSVENLRREADHIEKMTELFSESQQNVGE